MKITFPSLSRKSDEKEKKKNKTRMAIAKLFAFHANAKNIKRSTQDNERKVYSFLLATRTARNVL